MPSWTTSDPRTAPGERRLERPPSERYARPAADAGAGRGRVAWPVRGDSPACASASRSAGAVVTTVGGRAPRDHGGAARRRGGDRLGRRAPSVSRDGGRLRGHAVASLAVALALASVALGQLGLWLVAAPEGGTLGSSTTSPRRSASSSRSRSLVAGGRRVVAAAVMPARRPGLPAPDRGRPRPDRRARRRVVGRSADARAAAAAVVPALHRHVVDRRGRDGRLVGFVVALHQPGRPDDRLRPHDRRRPQPAARRHRPGPVRARLRRPRGRAASAASRPSPGRAIGSSVAFHRAIGFRVDDGPGTQPLYGTPAYPDYDGDGDDRVVFIRDL